MTKQMTGGCQCGRIRYRAALANDDAYLCHCRMCQRATGGFAAAFVAVAVADMEWLTQPDWYRSSPIAKRPFCSSCGTPLGFSFVDDAKQIDLTVGSFDDPSGFVPVLHCGSESLHAAWLNTDKLPRHFSAETESVASRWKAAGLEVPK